MHNRRNRQVKMRQLFFYSSLAELKVKLIELCGENIGKKRFSVVIDGFETSTALLKYQ